MRLESFDFVMDIPALPECVRKQSENQSVSRKIDADGKPLSMIFSVKSY